MIEVKLSFEILPYKSPVPVRKTVLTENRFLKVTLLDVDYFISTLPGVHESTLEEIAFKIKYFFSNYTLDFSRIDFSKKFFNLVKLDFDLFNIKNEVLFNIECLLLGIIKKSHPNLFTNNLVLENELYRADRGPEAYIQSKCLKIKIAPTSESKSIRLINELYRLNEGLILRLDGNRKFELDEMISFEASLKKNIPIESFDKIDYIEEPFKNFSDSFLFQKRSSLKIAMDESFSSYINCLPENFPGEFPVVIKPSLFGISTIHNWMQIHSKNRTIISSCFEHPSVRIGLVFLAQKKSSEFHGLENFL